MQKLSTFPRPPQNMFSAAQTNFSTFHGIISKLQNDNHKSTEHSGIRTQDIIIFKLFSYKLPVRCFCPLENLMRNGKVVRYKPGKPETAGIPPKPQKNLWNLHITNPANTTSRHICITLTTPIMFSFFVVWSSYHCWRHTWCSMVSFVFSLWFYPNCTCFWTNGFCDRSNHTHNVWGYYTCVNLFWWPNHPKKINECHHTKKYLGKGEKKMTFLFL